MNKHIDDRAAGSPETWLDEHGSALYRYALLHLRDPHKAEDAVQETLLAALGARERFSGGASARTWLIGILKHKVMDQFRRQVREVQLKDPDDVAEADDPADETDFAPSGHWRNRLSDWGNPEETLERGELIAFLQRCLDALPQRLAHLFWLREVMEEDTATICKELALGDHYACRGFIPGARRSSTVPRPKPTTAVGRGWMTPPAPRLAPQSRSRGMTPAGCQGRRGGGSCLQ